MAEPEELILEGAHFATRVARDVWRRYGTSIPDAPIPLAGVRVRLEIFLSALFGTPIPVARMEPPAPASWLSRVARGRSHQHGEERFLSGTDGRRVCLPSALPLTIGGLEAMSLYRLLAVQQAVRLVRRTPQIVRPDKPSRRRTLVPAGGSRRDRLLDRRRAARTGADAGRGACARVRTTRASSHVDAGRGVRTRGARVACRRSREAVPFDPRRLGRELARMGATAIGTPCRPPSSAGRASVVLGAGARGLADAWRPHAAESRGWCGLSSGPADARVRDASAAARARSGRGRG